jgi:Domain of unknown function (DUF4405)
MNKCSFKFTMYIIIIYMLNLKKNKSKINLVIDAIMLIVLMAVAGLGFLMKYVLLPGYKINELYDSDTELSFLGLDRHQWGAIHLFLAFILIFFLILHIILHWGMILSVFRQLITGKKVRIVISVLVGVLSIFLALAPLFVKPEIAPLQRKHNRNRVSEIPSPDSLSLYHRHERSDESALHLQDTADNNKEIVDSRDHHDQIAINGTMTLDDISAKYNINVEELAGAINVPVQYKSERLGRLKKRYGFEIDKLRVFIMNNSGNYDK